MPKEILFEGLTSGQILQLPDEEIRALVLTGEPILFTAGSAKILGEFGVSDNRLIVELAQVEGGGEGVLPSLWQLVEQYARTHGFDGIDWIVHAINCAKPNPKLRRVLEHKGFTIQEIEGVGRAYLYRVHSKP